VEVLPGIIKTFMKKEKSTKEPLKNYKPCHELSNEELDELL